MIPAGPALSHHEIVPSVAFVEIRTFAKDVFLSKKLVRGADELATNRVKFLDDIPSEAESSLPKVPLHIEEPFAAIVVVEKRRIETDGVQMDRIAPRALDRWSRNQEDMAVLERTSH